MALSNVAVQYLNYPTHILFKSAKPVPTLIVGTFLMQCAALPLSLSPSLPLSLSPSPALGCKV